MPIITVTDFDSAETLLEQAMGNYAHVVSIGDPERDPPRSFAAHSARKLRLTFFDVLYSTPNWPEAPEEGHVVRVIEFAAGVQIGDKVLVHCAAGVSRSSAVALTIYAAKAPRTEEGGAAAYARTLTSASHPLWPNPTIVGFADRLLEFNGALVRAHLNHRPSDADRF